VLKVVGIKVKIWEGFQTGEDVQSCRDGNATIFFNGSEESIFIEHSYRL
jgi:hypothetical protein